jgi:hypothetical protein
MTDTRAVLSPHRAASPPWVTSPPAATTAGASGRRGLPLDSPSIASRALSAPSSAPCGGDGPLLLDYVECEGVRLHPTQLWRVRNELAAKHRSAALAGTGDEGVREVLDSFRSTAKELHAPTVPLGRRREILRHFLPVRDGQPPIQVHVDPKAKRGWRSALRKLTVRHLTTRVPCSILLAVPLRFPPERPRNTSSRGRARAHHPVHV